MAVITRTDLAGKQLVWLLDVTFGGQVFRFASEQVDVPSEDGIILYDQGFEAPEHVEEFDLFGAPADPSMPFELVFPEDVASYIAEAQPLADSPAELSIWLPGWTWEERYTVLAGRVVEPVYGEEGEPVSFTVEQNLFRDRSRLPALDAVISASTWPSAAESSDGKPYPIVFGRPGAYVNSLGSSFLHPATPAYIVDTGDVDTSDLEVVPLLIAGHECWEGTVTVFDLTAGTTALRSLSHIQDTTGRTVAVVYLDGATSVGAMPADVGHTYGIGWGDEGTAAGLRNPSGTGWVRSAAELLRYLLEKTTLDVDRGRTAVLHPYLQSLEVAGYIDESAPIYDWLQDNLLPLLPVSLLHGPRGLYPVVWSMDVTEGESQADLVEGLDCIRVSRVSYERHQVFNEWKLSFAYSRKTSGQKTYVLLTGDQPDDDFRFKSSNVFARLSQARYGRYAADEIQTDIIYDRATARAILEWKSRYHAFPPRVVDYRVDTAYSSLEVGQAVTLTSAPLHLHQAPALIKAVRRRDDDVILQLLILEDPTRQPTPEIGPAVWDDFSWNDGSTWQ